MKKLKLTAILFAILCFLGKAIGQVVLPTPNTNGASITAYSAGTTTCIGVAFGNAVCTCPIISTVNVQVLWRAAAGSIVIPMTFTVISGATNKIATLCVPSGINHTGQIKIVAAGDPSSTGDHTGWIGTTALPIDLLSFTGKRENGRTFLSWSTASEKNVSHFEVEGSRDGKKFTEIKRIYTKGEYSTEQSYNIYIREISNLYYRLKTVDKDNSFDYSEIISVSDDKNNQKPTITCYGVIVCDPDVEVIVCDLYGRSERLQNCDVTTFKGLIVLEGKKYLIH